MTLFILMKTTSCFKNLTTTEEECNESKIENIIIRNKMKKKLVKAQKDFKLTSTAGETTDIDFRIRPRIFFLGVGVDDSAFGVDVTLGPSVTCLTAAGDTILPKKEIKKNQIAHDYNYYDNSSQPCSSQLVLPVGTPLGAEFGLAVAV